MGKSDHIWMDGWLREERRGDIKKNDMTGSVFTV